MSKEFNQDLVSLIKLTVFVGGAIVLINKLSKIQKVNEKLARAKVHMKDHMYTSALDEYRDALEINPKSAEAYLGLADAYIALDKIDRACDVLREGLIILDSGRIQEKLNECTELHNLFTDIELDDISDSDITTDVVFTMPEIVGKNYSDVLLQYPNIQFKPVFKWDPENLEGCILSTDPTSGTEWCASQIVTVTVNREKSNKGRKRKDDTT